MARMQTNSASYFPFDVDYFDDVKVRRLDREFPRCGPLVYLYLLSRIYSDRSGYCTELDCNLVFDASEKVHLNETEVMKIFNRTLDVGLFDRGVYEKYGIITARSIQERFQEMVRKKAVKTSVRVNERYWLLDEFETKSFVDIICPDKNSSEKNATNKRKENKIKEKEIKEEERKEEVLSAAAAELIKEYRLYIGKTSENIRRGIRNFLVAGMEPELVKRLIHYAVEQNKCSWQYIAAAAEGNISEGIMSLEDYNKSHEKRTAKRKKKGINNYIDTNKPDYSDFGQKIIEDMLREAEEKERSEKP